MKGYKLVPVEPTNEMVAAIQERITVTSRGGKIGCKSALREAIEAAPTPPQPICDEAKERELCKQDWLNTWTKTDSSFELYLEGWLACAQSRAKAGEVGHE